MNNDRLKFRVWADGTMYMPDTDSDTPFALNQHGSLIKSNDGQSYYWARIAHNERVVEQCTGLKDKNGNLIYDGDIIRWYGTHKIQDYKVVWVNAGWCLKNLRTMTTIAMTGLEASEIISNIHEQKEQQ